MKVLCTSKAEPCRLYGALDMLGTLNDLLMDTKSDYKDQMEQFLYYYVTPEFCHSQGYIRAKAYWVFRLFNEIKFKHEEMILASLFHAVVSSLIYDPDLPVRAAAATSLHMLLQGQNLDSFNYIESEIEQIVLQLLKIIYETEEIGLVCFLQNILSLYCEKLKPIIIDICQNLAKTFKKITETNNERSRNNNANVTVLSILSTIESLLISFENETEIIVMLNPVVVDIVTYIFLQNIKDYYDNACSLIYNLTNSKITPEMWKLLHLFYMVFQRDGFEYFADTIYILRNFVTVDTSAFLLDERNMLTILDMCKTILTGNAEENQHYSVVQLLGTIVNHCLERIDQHIPFIVELILNRLFQEIEKSELRTACQQIIKNVYDYNPGLLSEIMDKLKIPTLCKEILYVEISCM
ncbi:importin-7-like [Lycorma delicatula]|uniref:importin-7-like n=1 Tax=Lycorma delicatula TaxID=130591 RepID=UPI003F50E120